jgi:hypothetical protein
VNWLSEMSNNSSFVLVSSPQNVPENWLVLKFLHSEWKGKPSLNSLSCHINEKNHLLTNDESKCNKNNLSNLLKNLRLITYRFSVSICNKHLTYIPVLLEYSIKFCTLLIEWGHHLSMKQGKKWCGMKITPISKVLKWMWHDSTCYDTYFEYTNLFLRIHILIMTASTGTLTKNEQWNLQLDLDKMEFQ